ncbi:hypothetical protein NON00_23705, partial [Roseomonas sp. GC11]|nr:hypothetical protein [Roseomonas sp. GC11]
VPRALLAQLPPPPQAAAPSLLAALSPRAGQAPVPLPPIDPGRAPVAPIGLAAAESAPGWLQVVPPAAAPASSPSPFAAPPAAPAAPGGAAPLTELLRRVSTASPPPVADVLRGLRLPGSP